VNVRGVLMKDGWAGRIDTPVLVVGETPKRFRITPPNDEPVKLAGRARWLQPGQTALVPKHAVRLADNESRGDE
jgi:hypothetical protein